MREGSDGVGRKAGVTAAKKGKRGSFLAACTMRIGGEEKHLVSLLLPWDYMVEPDITSIFACRSQC